MTIIAGPGGAVPIPAPITFSEIAAYRALTHVELSAWEVALIRRLDLQAIRIATGADQKKPTLGQILREKARERKAKG